MIKKRVLYLSYESLLASPILKTQVTPLLEMLTYEYDITLSTFEAKNAIIQNYKFKTLPFRSSLRSFNLFSLVLFLIRNRKNFEIIHCRSYLPMLPVSILSAFLPNFPKIIFDLRGVFPEEVLMKYKKEKSFKLFFYFKIFKFLEKFFLSKAKVNIVVSNSFKNYLIKEYETRITDLGEKIVVIPTFVNTLNKVNVNDETEIPFEKSDVIFVYSGSIELWQKFPETVLLFKNIKKEVSNAKFLILTYDSEIAIKILESNGLRHSDFAIKNCNPNELPLYLKLADFAFLLREDDIVNNVAAPIKFTDYLLAGLTVILTRKIGDTEEIVRNFGNGIFLNGFSEEDMGKFVKENSTILSSKCKIEADQIIKKYYSIELAFSKYSTLYKHIIID